MVNKLPFKWFQCRYIDEVAVIIGIVFIGGLFWQNYSLTNRIHTMQEQHSQDIVHLIEETNKSNETAQRRLAQITRLETRVSEMANTVTQQRETIELLSNQVTRNVALEEKRSKEYRSDIKRIISLLEKRK